MINKQETIELFGYNPDILKPNSHKKVCVICDNCGKEQILMKCNARELCSSCANSGKNNQFYGKKHTEETKQKMRESHPHLIGNESPHWKGGKITLICAWCGKEFDRHKSLIRKYRSFCNKKCMGKWQSKNIIKENHPNWRGGVSFGKYCSLFNKSFKKIVRDNYNNRCFLCGKTKEENGVNLDVHHVNYDKNCLCGSLCEFVPLCKKCHRKTNFNRKYWEDLIMYYLYPNRYFMIDL